MVKITLLYKSFVHSSYSSLHCEINKRVWILFQTEGLKQNINFFNLKFTELNKWWFGCVFFCCCCFFVCFFDKFVVLVLLKFELKTAWRAWNTFYIIKERMVITDICWALILSPALNPFGFTMILSGTYCYCPFLYRGETKALRN